MLSVFYAECQKSPFMMVVVMLSVAMLNIVAPSINLMDYSVNYFKETMILKVNRAQIQFNFSSEFNALGVQAFLSPWNPF
jgi:hypothetical protein